MKEKLFALKKDNTIVIYQVNYDENMIKDLINVIKERFDERENAVMKVPMFKGKPLSFGKYDTMKNCNINYYTVNSFDSLDDNTMGEIKVNVSYPSTLASIIEKTFITDDNELLLNFTDLMKFQNHLYGNYNNFRFDKTLDLVKPNLDWNDKRNTIINLKEYNEYVYSLMKNLNNDDIVLNDKEQKKMKEEFPYIVSGLSKRVAINEIAMYPVGLMKDEAYKIMDRFAFRNEGFSWFDDVIPEVPDLNGAYVIKSYNDLIVDNYDLDRKKEERKTIIRLEQNKMSVNNLEDIAITTLDNKGKNYTYNKDRYREAA